MICSTGRAAGKARQTRVANSPSFAVQLLRPRRRLSLELIAVVNGRLKFGAEARPEQPQRESCGLPAITLIIITSSIKRASKATKIPLFETCGSSVRVRLQRGRHMVVGIQSVRWQPGTRRAQGPCCSSEKLGSQNQQQQDCVARDLRWSDSARLLCWRSRSDFGRHRFLLE